MGELAAPLFSPTPSASPTPNALPRVLFCGEATSASAYSTVHGAAFSGQREATRLKVALGLEVQEEAAVERAGDEQR